MNIKELFIEMDYDILPDSYIMDSVSVDDNLLPEQSKQLYMSANELLKQTAYIKMLDFSYKALANAIVKYGKPETLKSGQDSIKFLQWFDTELHRLASLSRENDKDKVEHSDVSNAKTLLDELTK
jgi:hypothetical protein